MDFREFIRKLEESTNDGRDGASFTKEVLTHMMTDEEGLHQEALRLLNEYKENTYRAAYGGKIGGIAKKCKRFLEPMIFEKYIESSVSGGAVEDLCLRFKDEIPDINEKNVFNKISLLLKKILIEASSQPRKKRSMQDASVINSYFKNILKQSSVKTFLCPDVISEFSDIYVRNYIKFDSKQVDPVNIAALEELNNHIIIQGTAGSGKTMLMKHLLFSSIDKDDVNKKVPVLLNKLNSYRGEDILSYILQSFQRTEDDVSLDNVKNWLNDKKLLLLIDGLDEIKSDYTLRFNEELESFSEKYSDITIVMSSRPIEDFIHFSSFIRTNICPLSQEQAIELVKKQKWNKEEKEQFISALGSKEFSLYSAAREYASTPLLLLTMLMAYSLDKDITQNNVSFYKIIYKTLTKRHEQAKNIKKELSTGLSYNVFEKYFEQLCKITYCSGVYEFDYITLERYVNTLLGEKETFTADSFITDLTDNICLMYKEGDFYCFIHRTIQEYYAALSFSHLQDNQFSALLDYYRRESSAPFQDNSFFILYELVPDRVEQLILLPFLERIMNTEKDPYLEFIENTYDCIWCDDNIFFYAEESKFGLYVTKIIYEKYSFKNLDDETPSENTKNMIHMELLCGPKYPMFADDPYHSIMTPIEFVLIRPDKYKKLWEYMKSQQCSIYKVFQCIPDLIEKIKRKKQTPAMMILCK